MIKITHNKRVYHIQKEKLLYILKRISNEKINEKDIKRYLKKYHLYDEYFLENINNIFKQN